MVPQPEMCNRRQHKSKKENKQMSQMLDLNMQPLQSWGSSKIKLLRRIQEGNKRLVECQRCPEM